MKARIKLVLENTVARRNPVAASLSAGQFRNKVVRSKRAYKRNPRNGGKIPD